jgi:hypothetical protein
MAKEWKLGVDMHELDNILDGITFDDVLTTVVCNEPEINEASVRKCVKELLSMRMTDFNELLEVNIKELVKQAKKRRD